MLIVVGDHDFTDHRHTAVMQELIPGLAAGDPAGHHPHAGTTSRRPAAADARHVPRLNQPTAAGRPRRQRWPCGVCRGCRDAEPGLATESLICLEIRVWSTRCVRALRLAHPHGGSARTRCSGGSPLVLGGAASASRCGPTATGWLSGVVLLGLVLVLRLIAERELPRVQIARIPRGNDGAWRHRHG